MTEADWLAANDPLPMLEFLQGKAGDRPLRLFAVACCRRIVYLAPDRRVAEAVALAEAVADGAADPARLEEVPPPDDFNSPTNLTRLAAYAACTPPSPRCRCGAPMALRRARRWAFYGCRTYPRCQGTRPSLLTAASYAAQAIGAASGKTEATPGWRRAYQKERAAQARLLRCVVNPFRPFAADPAWLAWNGGLVPKLARAIDGGRAFERLPVLADALEEAGCADAELLGHLRSPGPHVRGCWVVDLLLGKG